MIGGEPLARVLILLRAVGARVPSGRIQRVLADERAHRRAQRSLTRRWVRREPRWPRRTRRAARGRGALLPALRGAIPVDHAGRLLLLRRGFAPGKDLWTFPGGFVDLGETVEQAARREVLEELQIEIELGALVGVYSRATDRVMLVVYAATALGEPRPTPEAPEIAAFAPEEIPWDRLAFWSTERALKDFLG